MPALPAPDRDEILVRLRRLAQRPADHSLDEIREVAGWALEELSAARPRRKPRPPPTACEGQLTIEEALGGG